ncbi:glycosyltransferase [Saccharicrinis sp. GN24d3]|uniref:glycosyltransferase n=1 Tax=Saccharicrinis sp. GN24d3 TaxID=3458416 RepID=UPI00403538EA
MKILIVLPKLTCGGTERSAAELANFIASSGGDVSIVLMYHKPKFYELHPKVKLIEPDVKQSEMNKYFYIFFVLYFLRLQFKNLKPDIIFGLGYIALSLFSSLGIKSKVVISFRSSPRRVRYPNNKVINKMYEIAHRLLRCRVDGVIAQTNLAADIFRQKYKCPIVVIPNFLRKLNEVVIEKENQIVNVGHCAFEKGQKYLIQAFAKVNAPNWKLIIVGDGPLRQDLQKLASELGVGERVVFAGYQKDVDLFLSKSKIFAFSSIIEGYPNALIEAMATPLPSVSFDCEAGPSDIIKNGKNGYLVEVGDVDMFASRLQLLIDDEELRSSIQKQAMLIKTENELSKVAYKYLDFFNDICNDVFHKQTTGDKNSKSKNLIRHKI